jgi:hypothetical protein
MTQRHKKHVPVPMITNSCPSRCCERLFCPLKLSFGKTIDTFQGQNAGPVADGKPPNPVQRIICDPGARSFEGRKSGLFYTIISRATTTGTLVNGKRLDSAIYFYDYGLNSLMTVSRIINLRKSLDKNVEYKCISKRDKWVERLMENRINQRIPITDIENIFEWAKGIKVSKNELRRLIDECPAWRNIN